MKPGLFFICLFFLTAPAPAQDTIPFEEKAQHEKFLAQKVDDVLVKLLGPNQAKVIVETSMDFTKTEKVEYEKEKEGDKNPFKVQGQAGDVSGIEYLMPGFGIPKSGGGDSPKSYTKQMAFPSVFIKKIGSSPCQVGDLT